MCTNFAVISDSIKKVIKNFQKALPFKEAVEEIEKCIKELIFYWISKTIIVNCLVKVVRQRWFMK